MSSPRTFTAVNPATGAALEPEYTNASEQEVDQAARAADSAFASYRKTSGRRKAEFLERIGEGIVALGDTLIERCGLETGLPAARLTGERGRTVNQLRLFAEVLIEGSWVEARIDPALPDRTPIPRPDLRRMLIPLGPVAVFGASNFPLAFSVAGGDAASALAAGCPVVVKAHPAHPGTSDLIAGAIARAARETGMPDGVFSMVHGASVEVGQNLVGHPLIKAVGFTGSFRGGKALFDTANAREEPIPVFAEMGSVNPVFILPGALGEHGADIAEALAGSVTLGVGQFCTNPGLVVVSRSDASADFVTGFGQNVAASSPGTMLTEAIAGAYKSGVDHLATTQGVEVIARGQVEGDGPTVGAPCLLETTADALLTNPDLAEEVFGPSTLVVSCRSQGELLEVARTLRGHLTATIHGTDEDLADNVELIDVLEQKVGRLIFNGFPTGVEVGHAMQHGGPYPATTAPESTSVGTAAIRRFVRPICYQNFPSEMLPDELKDGNPLGIWRMVDGKWQMADGRWQMAVP
ncbi:MAG TPA: aldehyde dehydrogenase (NADP(+)) [Rhodothermales bacterium]|nr:aldehyde dehydrogenase (NADP(+)) [Rhodothermales bacterium]